MPGDSLEISLGLKGLGDPKSPNISCYRGKEEMNEWMHGLMNE